MSVLVVLVALAIALGVVGIVVPLVPGSLLVGAAILTWAAVTGGTGAWVTGAVCAALLGTASAVKYLVPGKRLQQYGVPTRALLAGGALGVVGFFVVPVLGLPLGFILGVYLHELQRTSSSQALAATRAAVRAVGLGMLIELSGALLAAGVWLVGVLAV